MRQEIIDLYDAYTHGALDRRSFLERLTVMAGGVTAALALEPLLMANPAAAAIVDPDDDRLATSRITYPAPGGPVKAYLARPKGQDKLPAIIVIHENRGLNSHIEDVTRRAALEGYFALGLDLLSPLGGTPANADEARAMFRGLDGQLVVSNVLAAMAFIKSNPAATGKVGVVGFCWGGGVVNNVAVAAPELDAGVAFYGPAPDISQVPNIKAKMLLHYAGLDDRINGTVFPAYIDALKAAGTDFTVHLYDGANHAFHNDTSAARYKEDAAMLAWQRSVEFFNATLKG